MEKHRLTKKEIEYDIKAARGERQDLSRKTYFIVFFSCAAVGILLAVLEFFYPKLALSLLGGLLAVLFCAAVADILLHALRKRRPVCLCDYSITRAILSHTAEESYRHRTGRLVGWHSRQITVYTLYFEKEKSFRLPSNNYTFDTKYACSDFALYQNCHRGDEFLLIIHRKTGKIAAVYPLALFVYGEI